jgi:hypothetical protein
VADALMESQEYGHEQHAFRMALQAPDERQASGRIERAPQYPCGGAWQNAVSSPTPHSRQVMCRSHGCCFPTRIANTIAYLPARLRVFHACTRLCCELPGAAPSLRAHLDAARGRRARRRRV